MENKEKKESLNKSKVLALIVILLIIIYVVYVCFNLAKGSDETYIIENGTINDSEKLIGYIIRDEKIVDDNIGNEIIKIKKDCEKVAKDENVYKILDQNVSSISEQLDEIDNEINKYLQDSSKVNLANKVIDEQIYTILNDLEDIHQTTDLEEKTSELDELMLQRVLNLNTSEMTYELQTLLNKRKTLQESYNQNAVNIKAPISGIVSYRVDGFEDVLSYSNLENLSYETLSKLEIQPDSSFSQKSTNCKIISSFNNCLVTFTNSQNARDVKVGKTVTLKTNDGKRISGKVESKKIDEVSNEVMLVFSINQNLEELSKYRKINFTIVWWENTGLKVPNNSLLEENDLTYVIRNRSGYKTKILVTVKKKNEDYAIIDNYSVDDLYELGFTQKTILNMSKIALYDEIMLEPEKYEV